MENDMQPFMDKVAFQLLEKAEMQKQENKKKAQILGPELVEYIRNNTEILSAELPEVPEFEIVQLDNPIGCTPHGCVGICFNLAEKKFLLTKYRAADSSTRWAVMEHSQPSGYITEMVSDSREENDTALYTLFCKAINHA